MSSECQKCEDNFCCIYLGIRTSSLHCRRQNCFCISCQSYNIEEKSPAVICQRCSFLSECYSNKFLGKVNRRNSYILQRHCIDHCQLENCPHKDEDTVELNRVLLPPDYRHLVQDGNPTETVDVQQQSAGTQPLKGRETPVPIKTDPRMVSGVSKKNTSRPKGLLASKRARRTGGSPGGTRRNRNVRSDYRLSSETVVRTRSTN